MMRWEDVFILYFSDTSERPYFEPIKALPLPDPDAPKIRNRAKKMFVRPTRSRKSDVGEIMMNRALDAPVILCRRLETAKEALSVLSDKERRLIEWLAAYRFDYSKAAHDWVSGRRGMIPGKSIDLKKFNAWCSSKKNKKNESQRKWYEIKEKLLSLIGDCH